VAAKVASEIQIIGSRRHDEWLPGVVRCVCMSVSPGVAARGRVIWECTTVRDRDGRRLSVVLPTESLVAWWSGCAHPSVGRTPAPI
jgi:hypothetical protein